MRNRKNLSVTLMLVALIWLTGGCVLPGTGIAYGYQEPVDIQGNQVIAALEQAAPNLEVGGALETCGGIVVSQGLYHAYSLDEMKAQVLESACCSSPDCYIVRKVYMAVAALYELDCQIAVGSAATSSDGYPPWFIIAVVYEYGSFNAYAIDLAGCVWNPTDCLIHEINFY